MRSTFSTFCLALYCVRTAQSKSEATLTLSCNDDGITYGNVFVEVSGTPSLSKS